MENVIRLSCNLPPTEVEIAAAFLQDVEVMLVRLLSNFYINKDFACKTIGATSLGGGISLSLTIDAFDLEGLQDPATVTDWLRGT
jgi:hypothetical protein